MAAAANAFGRAQRAEFAGRHAEAAELYELADSIAPAPEALRAALRQRLAADQLAVAASHAERLLARYPDDARSTELARETLERAAESLVRVSVRCEPRACVVSVDGVPVRAEEAEEHIVFVTPGAHAIGAAFPNGQALHETHATLGEPVVAQLSEPAAPVASSAPEVIPDEQAEQDMAASSVPASSGVTPAVFWVGLGLTAVAGGILTWSGIDTLQAHDQYVAEPTLDRYYAGETLELRTNILIGVTGALALGTFIVAFFTDWGGDEGASDTARLQVAPWVGVDGGGVGFRGSL